MFFSQSALFQFFRFNDLFCPNNYRKHGSPGARRDSFNHSKNFLALIVQSGVNKAAFVEQVALSAVLSHLAGVKTFLSHNFYEGTVSFLPAADEGSPRDKLQCRSG